MQQVGEVEGVTFQCILEYSNALGGGDVYKFRGMAIFLELGR